MLCDAVRKIKTQARKPVPQFGALGICVVARAFQPVFFYFSSASIHHRLKPVPQKREIHRCAWAFRDASARQTLVEEFEKTLEWAGGVPTPSAEDGRQPSPSRHDSRADQERKSRRDRLSRKKKRERQSRACGGLRSLTARVMQDQFQAHHHQQPQLPSTGSRDAIGPASLQ